MIQKKEIDSGTEACGGRSHGYPLSLYSGRGCAFFTRFI